MYIVKIQHTAHIFLEFNVDREKTRDSETAGTEIERVCVCWGFRQIQTDRQTKDPSKKLFHKIGRGM